MNTVEQIYQEMLSCYGEKTGLEPKEGTDLSVRLYALSAQIYGLYAQMEWVVRQAFPQTAEGEYLDRHARLRSLERKPALAAKGKVRFTAVEVSAAPREIPKGTVCMTGGMIRFETVAPAELPAGEQEVEVDVQAVEAGSVGNVAAGAIIMMAVAPVGIATCSNPLPCAGGTDRESDRQLRERVLETFRRLPNGANAAYYEQEALSFPQVAAATVVPRPRGIGSVDVILATAEGLPDEQLLKQLTEYFQQRREIAVDVQVKAPETTTVNLAVRVKAREGKSGEQVLKQVEDTLHRWFGGHLLGQSVLLAQIGSVIYSCDGVENYAIDQPAGDLVVNAGVLPVLGSLSVEAMV